MLGVRKILTIKTHLDDNCIMAPLMKNITGICGFTAACVYWDRFLQRKYHPKKGTYVYALVNVLQGRGSKLRRQLAFFRRGNTPVNL